MSSSFPLELNRKGNCPGFCAWDSPFWPSSGQTQLQRVRNPRALSFCRPSSVYQTWNFWSCWGLFSRSVLQRMDCITHIPPTPHRCVRPWTGVITKRLLLWIRAMDITSTLRSGIHKQEYEIPHSVDLSQEWGKKKGRAVGPGSGAKVWLHLHRHIPAWFCKMSGDFKSNVTLQVFMTVYLAKK